MTVRYSDSAILYLLFHLFLASSKVSLRSLSRSCLPSPPPLPTPTSVLTHLLSTFRYFHRLYSHPFLFYLLVFSQTKVPPGPCADHSWDEVANCTYYLGTSVLWSCLIDLVHIPQNKLSPLEFVKMAIRPLQPILFYNELMSVLSQPPSNSMYSSRVNSWRKVAHFRNDAASTPTPSHQPAPPQLNQYFSAAFELGYGN